MSESGKGDVEHSAPGGVDRDTRDGAEDHGRSAADPRTWGHRIKAWRDSIRERPRTYRIYRIAVAVVGGAIVIGGIALVPLPGPGWVIVFLGLALLATEFEWAARVEKYARDRVKDWTDWLGRQSVLVRVLVGVLTFAFVAAVLYGLFALTSVPGWVPDSWIAPLPGLEK